VQDDFDFDEIDFDGEYIIGEEKFFKLHEGGSIPEKYKCIYQYVVYGRAPADWTQCFDEILSASERNEAILSRY